VSRWRLHTWCKTLADTFARHDSVNHSGRECVRRKFEPILGEIKIHANTVEAFYSIFERGMKGVYQHCAERHLHRYLADSISVTPTASSSA
jgi:ISXO2-like transposase domain